MDKIWLYGIKCRARLGVPPEERRKPQEILVDVGLELDTAPAAAKDDFQQTVDYWGVEKAVREAVQTGERRLVETLAEQLAELILNREKRLAAVQVIVHKKPSVMPKTREVIVHIVRSRR